MLGTAALYGITHSTGSAAARGGTHGLTPRSRGPGSSAGIAARTGPAGTATASGPASPDCWRSSPAR